MRALARRHLGRRFVSFCIGRGTAVENAPQAEKGVQVNNGWLNTLLEWVGCVGPNLYLQAFVIVVGFLLLAKLIEWLGGATLDRLLARWRGTSGGQVAHVIHRAVFRTVALVGLLVAMQVLELPPRLATVTSSVVQSLLILIWISAGIGGGRLIIEGLSRGANPPPWAQPTTASLLNNTLRVVLALAAMYAILLAWNVNVTGLVASAGIIGLALSFAAQDTLGNLFAGVAILVDQPYRIGDYIVLDSGERGKVTRIGLRSTRLQTRDDEEISIPNGIMGRAKIINESGGPNLQYRLRVPVSVVRGSDVDQVIALLLQVCIDHPSVCNDPEPRVRLRGFGDSSLNFELLVWIAQPELRGLALHELNCQIYKVFARENIVMPFPQRDVHIRAPSPPVSAS